MTNTTKKYFTTTEALEDVKSVLNGYFYQDYSELHNETFNTDYYIIGTYEAKQALEAYGTFEAIEEIQDYENEQFGAVTTELGNPEQVANMLYYIKGYEALYENDEIQNFLNEHWSETATDETNAELIAIIDNIIGE